MTLIIVGLGPGDPELLTRKAWDTLAAAGDVYLRTRHHPNVEHLPDGPTYHSFDYLYESAVDFSSVYAAIVDKLTGLSRSGEVIYAVPGDPTVAEGTVTRLYAACNAQDIQYRLVHGVSIIEPTLAAVGADAGNGLQIVDALDVATAYHPPINPDFPALITQIYSSQVASDVKLTLMNLYPEEFEVTMVHAAGTDSQRVTLLPLYDIDRVSLADLGPLYVPRYFADKNALAGFEEFSNTVAKLRDPADGCPWDLKQTHTSLKPYLLEEAYEVLDAIDEAEQSGDATHLYEELGDLLLQVVLHTQLAIDEDEFRMADVISHIDAKLKRRHPHVWGDVDVNGDVNKVLNNWEAIKKQERVDKGEQSEDEFKSLLDGVPKSLPALAQSHAYDLRAIKVGFDWNDLEGVVEKVREEIDEILEAETLEHRFEEMGDLLLSICVWARWLGMNPEDALRAANRKFYERFSHMERVAVEQGKELSALTFDEWDQLWRMAKNGKTD